MVYVFIFKCVPCTLAFKEFTLKTITLVIYSAYNRVIIKAINSFGGGPRRTATTCRIWAKNPDLPAFQNTRVKNNKSEMGRWTAIGFLGQCVHWNSVMSAPKSVDCPLHSLTRPNTTPLFQPHVRAPSQERTCVSAGTFIPAAVFSTLSRFDWLRASRGLSGYCSFCTGPFWWIKGTLSRPAPQSLPFHRIFWFLLLVQFCLCVKKCFSCGLLISKFIIVLYLKSDKLSHALNKHIYLLH